LTILPQTEKESALAVAERLRESFANTILSPLPGTTVSMTVSIGVSQYIPAEQDFVFLKRADAGLLTQSAFTCKNSRFPSIPNIPWTSLQSDRNVGKGVGLLLLE
jgi:GGDEF domain-containing protein